MENKPPFSRGSNAIQELIKGGELHQIHLFGEFRIDVEAMRDDPRGHHRRDIRWSSHDEAA